MSIVSSHGPALQFLDDPASRMDEFVQYSSDMASQPCRHLASSPSSYCASAQKSTPKTELTVLSSSTTSGCLVAFGLPHNVYTELAHFVPNYTRNTIVLASFHRLQVEESLGDHFGFSPMPWNILLLLGGDVGDAEKAAWNPCALRRLPRA